MLTFIFFKKMNAFYYPTFWKAIFPSQSFPTPPPLFTSSPSFLVYLPNLNNFWHPSPYFSLKKLGTKLWNLHENETNGTSFDHVLMHQYRFDYTVYELYLRFTCQLNNTFLTMLDWLKKHLPGSTKKLQFTIKCEYSSF